MEHYVQTSFKSVFIYNVVWFSQLVQRIFKCGNIQNISLRPSYSG